MSESSAEGSRKRRRRRRRRKTGPGEVGSEVSARPEGGEREPRERPEPRERGGRDRDRDPRDRDRDPRDRGDRGGRRRPSERDAGGPPGVAVPGGGKQSRRRRRRRTREAPISSLSRRRSLTRTEMGELEEYFRRMPRPIIGALYKGLGGQPGRIGEHERMVQLAVRAIAQGKRLGGLLKGMHERERTALALLIQCGGLAHSEELHRELMVTLGGHDREWTRVMINLAERGLVSASEEQDGVFFYLVPDPLVEHLVEHLEAEMTLPTFAHAEVRVRDHRPFCPPFDFSVATLCTYIAQRPPRLTQQQEIFKVHKEEMDRFFAQLWDPSSELFNFHIDFLMEYGLVELRGDRLALNRPVAEEWLHLDPQDQRDLVFRSLERRFPYAEWVLWAVHSGKGEWVPEKPLQALYRRWTRGEDWRKRLHRGDFGATRTHERDSWSFAPLVHCGMLELGEWGQEKFYRLTPRAQVLLAPPEQDEFTQFYLTPSFEIMAPAGLATDMLFRVGELAELTGCDRANTYRITEISVEQSLEHGWKRDEIIDFLRDGSQIGMPDNVEATLKGWIGQQGDVEFHDCLLMSVHRSRIRHIEAARELKPWLLHRFAPGLYAVDRAKLPELGQTLLELGFQPSREINRYPANPEQSSARERLLQMVADAREASEDPLARAQAADTQPEDLHPVPGTSGAKPKKRDKKAPQPPPRVTPREARAALESAIALRRPVEVVYETKDGSRVTATLLPERLALNPQGEQVFVARNQTTGEVRTWQVARVERITSP